MRNNFDFKEIADLWMEEKQKHVKLSSISAYRANLEKHLIPYFRCRESISNDDIQCFINDKLKEGLSVKRIKDLIVVLKMVMRHHYINNPSYKMDFNIVLPKEYALKELQVFTIAQQRTLTEYLYKNLTFKNLGILLGLYTGIRIGELCALKWKDVDFTQGSISVNKTLYRIATGKNEKKTELVILPPKTKHSYRTIPLCEELLKRLKENIFPSSPEFYVLTNKIYPCEPRNYRIHYKKVLQTLGLPELKFHCLRHSFATRCIESHCEYKALSMILGHSDISTTLNLYVHPSIEQRKQCIERMLKSLEI